MGHNLAPIPRSYWKLLNNYITQHPKSPSESKQTSESTISKQDNSNGEIHKLNSSNSINEMLSKISLPTLVDTKAKLEGPWPQSAIYQFDTPYHTIDSRQPEYIHPVFCTSMFVRATTKAVLERVAKAQEEQSDDKKQGEKAKKARKDTKKSQGTQPKRERRKRSFIRPNADFRSHFPQANAYLGFQENMYSGHTDGAMVGLYDSISLQNVPPSFRQSLDLEIEQLHIEYKSLQEESTEIMRLQDKFKNNWAMNESNHLELYEQYSQRMQHFHKRNANYNAHRADIQMRIHQMQAIPWATSQYGVAHLGGFPGVPFGSFD